jgi:guanylate kinase
MKKGLLFLISAPAGTGKTTLVQMLLSEFLSAVESVSFTTRPPRANETPGKDYHFVTRGEFEKKIKDKDFLEHAEVFGHYYGTSKRALEELMEKGKHVILVIDTQGALQIFKKLEAVSIFISPPNLEELQARLYRRKSETDEAIANRLSWAEKEMSLAPKYTYHIVNDHLKTAYDALRSIFIAEEHRNR